MNSDAVDCHGGTYGSGALRSTQVIPIVLGIAFVLMIVMVSAEVDAESETFTVDGVNYEINGDFVSIVGISAPIENYSFPDVVSNNFKDYVVTSINANAFNNLSQISGELILPSSLQFISKGAFSNCNDITSVKIESGYLDEYAFSKKLQNYN